MNSTHSSLKYLHQNFQIAIAIAREYHKPDLFITFTGHPQRPEITHSHLPNQQPQDRPDGKLHLLSKLYDKSATLAEPLLLLNMMDIGTLHLLHQYHLLMIFLVPKSPNGSKMPNLHTVCLCNTVFLLK